MNEATRIKGAAPVGELGASPEEFQNLHEFVRKTEATYNIELSLGPLVPKAISSFLAEQSLPRLLSQYKARAESLGGG